MRKKERSCFWWSLFESVAMHRHNTHITQHNSTKEKKLPKPIRWTGIYTGEWWNGGGNLLNTKKKRKCEIYAPKWSCWAGQRRKPSGVAVECQTRWPTGGNNNDCPGSLSLSFLFYNKIKHTHLEKKKKKKSPALHTLRLWLGETAVW